MALPAPALAGPLADALDLALQRDPEWQLAQAQVAGQQAASRLQRAALLPQLSWDAAKTRQQEPQSATTQQHQWTLSQVLFDLAQWKNWRSQQLRGDAQAILQEAARQALLQQLAERYFDVLAAQDALAVAQTTEQAFADLVKDLRIKVDQGLMAPLDLDLATSFESSARSITLQQQQWLEQARTQWRFWQPASQAALPGLAPSHRFADPQGGPEHWWQLAQQSPRLRAQQLLLEAAQADVDAARAGHLPTLQARWSQGSQKDLSGSTQPQRSVGVSLSLPLDAGGAVRARTEQALAALQAQQARGEQERRAVEAEVRLQRGAWEAAVARTRFTQEGALAAQRAVEATRTGQALGTRTLNDLLAAIQSQGQARLTDSQARQQAVLASLRLKAAAGQLTREDILLVDQSLQ